MRVKALKQAGCRADVSANDGKPGNFGAVRYRLDEFALHVQSRLSDGSISQDFADSLTAFSEAIEVTFGC